MREKKSKLPFIIHLILITTMLSCVGGELFGFAISGYSWAISLSLSLLLLTKEPGGITFPVKIWLPWIITVIIYAILAVEVQHAVRRSIMFLCPIIVGITVSKIRINEQELQSFSNLFKKYAIALCIIVFFKSGLLITGSLPSRTGLAPEVMTGSLFAAFLAIKYVLGEKNLLIWWGILAALPVISVTRMGVLANGLTLPLAFVPMSKIKRIVLLVLIGITGLSVFYSPRFQAKMFYSGGGTLAEVRLDNPDFATTGRIAMWDLMQPEIKAKPYLGHGANANERFVLKMTGILGQPHNDWARLMYDYGYIGAGIFTLCMLMQVLNILKMARISNGETRILYYTGATSFLSFSLFMLSDNILLYASFFGNLQFTILGIAYAAHKTKLKDSSKVTKRPRIKIRF
jgi:hypothetical protein